MRKLSITPCGIDAMSFKSKIMKNHPESRIQRDIETVSQFIRIYCDNNHRHQDKSPVRASGKIHNYLNGSSLRLCRDCKKLLLYSASKRIICPYNPKPSCKKCTTHCYSDQFRDAIREVMRFSGLFLIKNGRLGLLKKYFF
jgi:hypothetical protein